MARKVRGTGTKAGCKGRKGYRAGGTWPGKMLSKTSQAVNIQATGNKQHLHPTREDIECREHTTDLPAKIQGRETP